MFQSVIFYNKTTSINGKNIYVYRLTDTNFISDCEFKTRSCAPVISIIKEYSKRNLNVANNLKIYFTKWIKDIGIQNIAAIIDEIEFYKNNLDLYAPIDIQNLYNEAYPCLLNHIAKLQFTGKIK